MRYLAILFFITLSCKQKKIEYLTNDWFESNLTVSSKQLYRSEKLQIKVNDKIVYEIAGDLTSHSIYKFLKIPHNISKIEVTSFYQDNKILNKLFIDTFNAKRYQIVISPPYPKNIKFQPFPYKAEWMKLPIDSIKRDIIIKPDTSKNNIIL